MEQEVVTVGLDLPKNVFQVHAIAADGAVLIRRKLHRSDVIRFFGELSPCLVGMEACASAHHRARELIAIGHEVRLMPPMLSIREAREDRCGGCRSDLRSGHPPYNALRRC